MHPSEKWEWNIKRQLSARDTMKEMCTVVINDNIHDNYVDYSKIKTVIRDELSKYLSSQTGNKPMIISVIQEV